MHGLDTRWRKVQWRFSYKLLILFYLQQLFRLNFLPQEDAMRFQIYKKKYEETFEHNERYARGEIYYPIYTRPLMHETEAEEVERSKQPIICD